MKKTKELFKNLKKSKEAIEFIEFKKDELDKSVEALAHLEQYIIDTIIDTITGIEDFQTYCGNIMGVNGFAVDEAFEAVYYGKSFKKVKEDLLKLKSLVQLEKQKESGYIG